MNYIYPNHSLSNREVLFSVHNIGLPTGLRLLAIICYLMMITSDAAQGQMLVSTRPENKNFLIEKGTGHVCGSCPGIELRCDSILAAHPGRGMMIEYHFGPDALPQAPPIDYDFTTPYGDTISDANKLNWPFYLNMMMNRRDRGQPYGSTFIFGATNQVQAEADTIVTQPSPVNLYLSSTFNNASRLLTVKVQAYYTAASATSTNYLQLALTQDSIISTQYDANYPSNNHLNNQFVFMNVFRANLNGFNGDTIANASAGRLISRTYTYTIPATYKNIICNPQHCNLTLYVADQKAGSGQQSFTGQVINTTRAKVGGGTPTAINSLGAQTPISIFPNPATGIFYMDGLGPGQYVSEVSDIRGQIIHQFTGDGGKQVVIDLTHEANGIYFIRVNTAGGSQVHKIILAK